MRLRALVPQREFGLNCRALLKTKPDRERGHGLRNIGGKPRKSRGNFVSSTPRCRESARNTRHKYNQFSRFGDTA